MANKLIFNCTHGREDPERASLPFVAANVAATAGQEAIVFCTIDAVWLGTKGGTEGVAAKGLDPLSKIYSDLVGKRRKGVALWSLCQATRYHRGTPCQWRSHRRRGKARRGSSIGSEND